MTDQSRQPLSLPPYKSVAAALIFSVILGPVGLLYASFWGGFFMILIGMVVISSQYIFSILFLWIICCVWAVRAVESYNKKLSEKLNKMMTHA